METPNNTDRPQPPDDITGDALLEWHRVTEELESLGTLHRADRALLVVWCRTWATWSKAAKVVDLDGPVVLLPNNWPGESAEHKVMAALTKTLDKLAASLGLSAAARRPQQTEAAGEITF